MTNHKDRQVIFAVAVLWAMPLSAAWAQGNAAEAKRNRQELGRNQRQTANDRIDLKRLRNIAQDWRAAVRAKDAAKERAADQRLATWLRQENREERREVKQANAERRQAKRERNRSIREAKRSGSPDDRRDLRDDRRDLRDDRRDAKVAQAEAARLRKLTNELAKMQPAFTAGKATKAQYKRKGDILKALLAGEKREMRQNRRESREDRRERREDRRERREDRRRRN